MATLRQFARPRPPAERCELCSLVLAPGHQHLIEPPTRRLLCCCEACGILFSSQVHLTYQRVPRDVWSLPDFRLADAQWDSLLIPINLAFFYRSSPAGRVVVLYPGPAGATESLLELEAWEELAEVNPVLRELAPDVEALLVNRVERARQYYRAPIDECFKLVGIIRTHWRGFSGGTAVWQEIDRFFAELQERANPWRERSHA
jgi:hypothetical protein